MTRSTCITSRKGFSLLEAIVVVTVMAIVLGAAAPSIVKGILNKYAAKTALDIVAIQEASRAYMLDKKSWPSTLGDLTSGGQYLPATWNGKNPFNQAYTIFSTPALLTVSTVVQDGAQKAVANNLPASIVSGTTVTSSIGTLANPAPKVLVVTGTIPHGGTIPLPAGYTESQCQWMVGPRNAQFQDSSGRGGCESILTVSTYLSGRTATAFTSGSCRGTWSFTLNYIGVCQS